MASRYWVGGNGTWDTSSTGHWSASSGGASGASAPTSSDAVYFDGSSGNAVVSIASGAACAGLVATGFIGNLNMTGSFSVYGSLTLATKMTFTSSDPSNVIFFRGAGAQTINTYGLPFGGGFTFAHTSSATYTLQSVLRLAGTLRVDDIALGSLDFAGYDSYMALFNCRPTQGNVYILNLGNGTMTLTFTGTTNATFNLGLNSNLTVNPGSGTIKLMCNVTDSCAVQSANGSGNPPRALNYIWIAKTGPGACTLSGVAPTALRVDNGAGVRFPTDGITVTGDVTILGTKDSPARVVSTAPGFQTGILNKSSGVVNARYANIKSVTAQGGAIFNDFGGQNQGGNTGWVFQTQDPNMRKRWTYKVYSRAGVYLGELPNVISDFGYSLDINSFGSQISIDVGVSADTSYLPVTASIDDESGISLQDESGDSLLTEGAVNIVGTGVGNTLIKNGNKVKVYEYSQWYPNGFIAFSGEMDRWEAGFSAGNDKITIAVYADGQDLQNYLVQGSPLILDVSQLANDQTYSLYYGPDPNAGGKGDIYNFAGQTFVTGANTTALGAIGILLAPAAAAGSVTVTLWPSVAAANSGSGALGSATRSLVGPGSVFAEYLFTFSSPIATTINTTYFFTVTVGYNTAMPFAFSGANPYANGNTYTNSQSSPNYNPGTSGTDFAFRTYRNAGNTTAIFATQDPTSGIAKSIIDKYVSQGGLVNYGVGSIDSTGISVPYTFNTARVSEGISKVMDLSPSTFYYTVDVGTSILSIRQISVTADFKLVRGKHIQDLKLAASTENLTNKLYFTGGEVTPGINLFKLYQDTTSLSLYGQRLGLDSDNRVTVDDTANAIGTSNIAENSIEQYQTTVIVSDAVMDTTFFKPGMIVGFTGYGTFIDSLLLRVSRIDKNSDNVGLTLGVIPPRLSDDIDQIIRGLLAEQTIDNPSSPS